MGKSCVKIKPITGSSEKHNTREIEPKYLIPLENGIENIHIVDSKIEDVRKEIEENILKQLGKRCKLNLPLFAKLSFYYPTTIMIKI